jgi:cytochrome c
MPALLMYYGRLLGLFALLLVVIGFNFATWGLHRHPTQPALYVPGARAERGSALIQKYGCGGCHTIPEIRGASGRVGPRLDHMKELVYIAGVLPNTPHNLTDWIANPREANPRTAMPNLGVTPQDARDIAEFLYRLP